MSPPPAGWPRVTSAVFYDDPAGAIDWLCQTFGFAVRLRVEGPDGAVVHSELTLGDDGLVMVGGTSNAQGRDRPVPCRGPRALNGAVTQALAVFVDDVDAHFGHTRDAGATIIDEPETHDYGPEYWADRTYRVLDCEGHHWWFMQRMR